ncbi:MAG TPA: cytochrome c3 family protein, partial [Bryobacteraceae bacterium]|nr:cytochrome c3 family protein [Bryobacteraceae bacterium]
AGWVAALALACGAAAQQVPANVAIAAAPVQPLPYSHKTHLAQGLQCRTCHTNPDPGGQMTFPSTATCMSCHSRIAKGRPAIMKLAEFARSNQPIPWVRVYRITPGVTWSHRRHLQAGMQCAMCHGDVAQLSTMAETTAVTAMASCIGCHQAHNAATTCATCHAWPRE